MTRRGLPWRRVIGSPLALIALLFLASAAARLGPGIGAALAGGSGDAGTTAPAPVCEATPAALAAALSGRERAVETREIALSDREAALQLAEEIATRRLTELRQAEEDLARTLSIADGAAEADLARLTAVYEAMKPKDAAALFAAMDPAFAAGFLGRMRPEAAAAVLSGMPPEAGFAVSAVIAGRNATAPRE